MDGDEILTMQFPLHIVSLEAHVFVTGIVICITVTAQLLFSTSNLGAGPNLPHSFYDPCNKASAFCELHGADSAQAHDSVDPTF